MESRDENMKSLINILGYRGKKKADPFICLSVKQAMMKDRKISEQNNHWAQIIISDYKMTGSKMFLYPKIEGEEYHFSETLLMYVPKNSYNARSKQSQLLAYKVQQIVSFSFSES